MRSVVVCKSGSVLGSTSASGEAGETEGVLRHFVGRGDVRVVYFGRVNGQLPDGVTHVDPDVGGVDEWCTAARQLEGFENNWERLRDCEALCVINVCGYSPTMSHVDNPHGAQVQAAAIRYNAPMLDFLERARVPRICVVTDPRLYPKDQEMSLGWEWARPRALLDQWSLDARQVVGGVKYARRSVYAACQSWAWLPQRENSGTVPACVLGHAHVEDGIKKGSWGPWWDILPRLDQWPDWLYVAGKGWDSPDSRVCQRHYKGCVSQLEMTRMLTSARCCPVVAHTPGFYTGKPHFLMSHGCVPILYGRGEKHTWDLEERYLSIRSRARVTNWYELRREIEGMQGDEVWKFMQDWWRKKLQPKWEKLDECVDELLSGAGTESPEWWTKYGGYRKC
jgi:hypothetical protein